MFSKKSKGLSGLLFTLLILAIVVYVATGPQQPAADSSSASWLQRGPYSVGTAEFNFVDDSRSTNENRGFAGSSNRTLKTSIWYPQDLDEALPLIIHSHGIMSRGNELANVAERLASHGYAVAAADYPLTNGQTPGGANASDVTKKRANVTFLID